MFSLGNVSSEEVKMKVKELSREELQALIQEAVENAMFELLGDPDQGLDLKEGVKERLMRSLEGAQRGERGTPAEEVAKRAGLNW